MPVKGHSGCEECRLNCAEHTWAVPHDFNYNAQFLMVLDQYNPTAVKKAKKVLDAAEFPVDNVEFAFTTRCFAGDAVKAQVREGQKCVPLLKPILEQMSKDTIIVPMGATPCKLVAGAKSIQTAHGTVMADEHQHVVIPTLSPIQTIVYPESLPTFEADLQVIRNAAKGEFTQAKKTFYTLVDNLTKFKQMVAELWLSEAYAFDIEATSLDPFRSKPHPAKIVGLSFSYKAETAFFLPLDHPGHVWSKKERAYIVKMLKVLLEAKHNRKIAHNGKYDIKYIRKVLDILVEHYDFDTLLAHYVAVNEQAGTHGLKILAWEFTDMGGYDDALDEYKREHPEADPDQGGHYGNIPLEIIWQYGAADADCTFRLYEIFKPMIHEKFADVFYNIVMPAVHGLADIEYEGAPIDIEWLRYCQQEFPRLLAIELNRLREFPEVLAVENALTQAALSKKKAERVKRFKVRSQAILELQATYPVKAEKSLARLRGDIERAKLRPVVVKPIEFNPKSPDQVTMLFYDFMEYTHTKKTKEGNRSADKEVLKDWWFEHKHPVIMAVGKYVKLMTLYAMFVRDLDDIMGDDGRIRGSYNVAGTETGRLSMSEPNLQQIPRNLEDDAKEPFVDASWPSIKRLFASLDDDYVVMQFDYSQAELRVLAALSQDPVLLQAYANDEDVHQRVSAEVEHVEFDQVTKEQRNKAKRVNFGLLYGQGAKKLAALIGCTLEEAKDFIARYFKRLKKVQKWINGRKAQVRETGESWSPDGRLRRLMSAFSPDENIVARAERQGVNSPIQAAASDCTLKSIPRIIAWLKENKMLSRIVITVHDSILMLVHKSEVAAVAENVVNIMENPIMSEWLKGVKMKADREAGKNWGQLYKIKNVEDVPQVMEEIWKQQKAA